MWITKNHIKGIITVILVSFFHFGAQCQLLDRQHKIDSIERIIQKSTDVHTQNFNYLSELWLQIDNDSSLFYAKLALKISQEHDDENELLRSNYNMGRAYYMLLHKDSALVCYNSAMLAVSKKTDKKVKANLQYNIGQIFYDLDSLNFAFERFTIAVNLFKETSDTITSEYMLLCYKLAYLYKYKGDYGVAINLLNKSFDIAINTNNTAHKGLVYSLRASVHQEWSQYEKAAEEYRKAISIFEKTNNKKGALVSTYNLSHLYKDMHDYARALITAKESLEAFRKFGVKSYELTALRHICSIYIEMHNYEEALKYLDLAFDITDTTQRNIKLINCYFYYGEIYYGIKNYPLAIEYYNKGKSIAIDIHEEMYANNIWLGLSKAYCMGSQPNVAVRFMEEYRVLSDSAFAMKSETNLEELEVKYETKLKEQEIEKLSAEKAQQKLQLQNERKNHLLLIIGALLLFLMVTTFTLLNRAKQKQKQTELSHKKSDMENKLLRSQMNPHFMFNSLNSVQNFILKNDKMQACNYLSNFSDLIRDILQNSRQSLIPLDEELETLGKYLQLEQLRFKDKLNFTITTNLDFDASEINIPPMILQPYIENAIIHGIAPKKSKGSIDIAIENNGNDFIKCTIRDNGIGRKAAAKNKKLLHSKSLGMLVTAERLQQLQKESGIAEVRVCDLYDGEISLGTRVELILPIGKTIF